MLAACSVASRHIALFSSAASMREAAHLDRGGRLSPVPQFDAAVRDQIERGDALGDARGMIVFRRHQHDAVAEPDALGALRTGGEEHLRRGGVRIFLEEMVLDLPDVVDAELVGELDLLERFLVQPTLGALAPRLRQLVFVEQAEFHRSFLPELVPHPLSLRGAKRRFAPLVIFCQSYQALAGSARIPPPDLPRKIACAALTKHGIA